MKREEFIRTQWRRYPQQSDVALDCAQWLERASDTRVAVDNSGDTSGNRFGDPARDNDEGLLVAGRLHGRPGNFHLFSAGTKLALDFSDQAVWSQACLRPDIVAAAPFDEAILHDGDLLCVRARNRDGRVLVSEVSLLFASADPVWDDGRRAPFELSFSSEIGRAWHDFTDVVRGFFREHGFIEVQTPALVPSPGTEPFLDPFATQVVYGSRTGMAYLPTSPEFHLKKLLAAGWTRVFELKTCFRNNEGGHHHQPEFTMLEWYRGYADLEAIISDTERLITRVAMKLRPVDRKTNGIEGSPRLRRVSMADLFRMFLDFELRPDTSLAALSALAAREGIPVAAEDSWDDVFFRIFISKVEPGMMDGAPWLVRDYPSSQAALARLNERGWADRFEVYWHGLEIANAFHELNDPEENHRRFMLDATTRAALKKTPVPHDEELLNALYSGMPPSGGIALGLDRLFMAVMGIDSIEETRPFPYRTPT